LDCHILTRAQFKPFSWSGSLIRVVRVCLLDSPGSPLYTRLQLFFVPEKD